MRPRKAKTEEKGFILIVVLCMIMALMVFLLGFNRQCRANLCAVDDFQKSQQALNYARAGLNITIAAIRDANNIDINKKLQNLFSGEKHFAVGDGQCSVTITEEAGKLNVNLLKDKTGKLNRARIDQLLRLIDLLNQQRVDYPRIGYGLVPSIIDWTDRDDEVTFLPFIKHENSGAESGYYNRLDTPYNCKNALLDTTEDLLLVKSVTPQVFEIIHDYITVYGNGEININCTSRYVIESLSEDIDPTLAQMIIDRRRFKPFDNITELRDIPGMTDSVYYTIKKTATISPAERYYHVTSVGNAGHLKHTIEAILKRNMKTKNVEIILYKEL